MKCKLVTTDIGYILQDVIRKSELILWCDINQAWYLESGKTKWKIDSANALQIIVEFKRLASIGK